MGIHPSDTRDTRGGISHRKQYSPHTTLHTDVHGLFTDFSFRHKNARNKIIRDLSVIIRVKHNLRLKDTTENHGDTLHTDVHG